MTTTSTLVKILTSILHNSGCGDGSNDTMLAEFHKNAPSGNEYTQYQQAIPCNFNSLLSHFISFTRWKNLTMKWHYIYSVSTFRAIYWQDYELARLRPDMSTTLISISSVRRSDKACSVTIIYNFKTIFKFRKTDKKNHSSKAATT